jgi:transcriptional regulator with XRE-family HTH domain
VNDGMSPMRLRRRLRTEIRTARLKSNLTQEQVAKAMEWSLSKMNRIEQAKSGISANDLRALLALYGIKDKQQVEELVGLARESRQTPWWRRQYGDVAPEGLLELMDYESAAAAINQFETTLVPGILQIEEYASAVLQVFYGEKSSADRLAELRTARRDMLSGEKAPAFSFIMDESVIHRVVGSPAVTRRQLLHLIDLADLANVTIQVVPFGASPHPGMKGSFKVVEFEGAPGESIVFVEGPRGDFLSDDPGEAQNYLEEFRRIQEKSLSPLSSADIMRKAAAGLT